MSTVVKIENLSKRYVIGHKNNERYSSLRDVITSKAGGGARKILDRVSGKKIQPGRSTREEFWALKDINLEIQQGDRIGIIGRNGAGKSTLLKVLSRITEPTTGRVTISGRVASLLEVGTGFHPELSGRENIFLNGAILGMSKSEIKSRFDEIVDFAEIERFLDTPVKRYSSGMYVRLAFSVAAHLEPEILIVDEVLSVGDAAFQKKCLGKMEQVSGEDRTVLFVSHNMSSIQQLCNRGVLLGDGSVVATGTIDKVVESYLRSSELEDREDIAQIARANPDYGVVVQYVDAWAVNANGMQTTGFKSGESISFNLLMNARDKIDDICVVAGIDTYMDYRIATVLSGEEGVLFSASKDETLSVNLTFPGLHLKPGTYSLTLGIRRNKSTLDHIPKAIYFEVTQAPEKRLAREQHIVGDVLVDSAWQLTAHPK